MSNRADRKRGRWTADLETARIFDGMRGWQQSYGDWLDYYRLDPANSEFDPVYEEATGNGVRFLSPVQLPCLHVTHMRGGNEYGDSGFYYNDTLSATIPFDLFVHCGMTLADIDTGNYMRDRVVYDQKVFKVTELAIRGQIQRRDIIVGLDGTQVKPDELVDCPQLIQYARFPAP
jgi:hypothetical protein